MGATICPDLLSTKLIALVHVADVRYASAMALHPFVYNPFGRPLGRLESADLAVLRDAAEGWFLDYKRDVPRPRDAAKSLAAFANSYGGWIIYGVDSPGGGQPVPDSFPGIADADVPRVLEMVQRAAATVLSPAPFFETAAIPGPCEEVGLPAERSVVVVRVPPGAFAPYIHNDGRIYRRVGDAKEPTPETDRHALDLLWQRSQDAQGRWEALLAETLTVSQGESRVPILHVFLSCDPYGDRGTRLDLDFTGFVRAMQAIERPTIPFDNFFPSSRGFVARQVGTNDPYKLVATWRQESDGTAIVSVPLPYEDVAEAYGFTCFDRMAGCYRHAEAYSAACRTMGLSSGRVIDLNLLPHLLYGILERYRSLLSLGALDREFFTKVRVDETWRCIPFMDLPSVAAEIEKRGLAMIQDEHVFAPEGAQAMLTHLPVRPEHGGPEEVLVESLGLLEMVCASLGVVLSAGEVRDELTALLERAQEAQRGRSASKLQL